MADEVKITIEGQICKSDGNDPRDVDLTVALPLRDLFAAFALAGLVVSDDQDRFEPIANSAYEFADAMLKARGNE